MSTIDSQLLHVHRKPIYQKRPPIADNHTSVTRAHSPSPRKTVFTSRRRHSTPQASTIRVVELKSPQTNAMVKHYYLNTRATRALKEQNPKSDLIKCPPRPITLMKPRYQDERTIRLPATPTSINSSTDFFLSTPRINRSLMAETPKHYYLNTRATRALKEQNPKSDLIKCPPRPITLMKPRYQDERTIRLPATPTSINSSTDFFLSTPRINRSLMAETPSSIASELQSINQSISTKRQWHKRQKSFSFDFGSQVFMSDDESLEDDAYNLNSTKTCKCCYRQCSCQFPYRSFHQCHYSCTLCCWIICLLLALALLAGIYLVVKVLEP
ncbi:unnamed protein product [Adineta steineri]|uniref:Uncharacterized protein n=1 Tax=Adineta steineri TaxID=433720 RepID=A0A814ANK8_9BILA|nr:unnamed protein product [Adineta steineri]